MEENSHNFFYNQFVEQIKDHDNKFTLSDGYKNNFINSETIKTIWKCVSINNTNTPTIYYGFFNELYFTLNKPEKIQTDEFNKSKTIEKVNNPFEFLNSKPFPKSFERKYKVTNWNELNKKIDINKEVYNNQSYLFQLFRYHLKIHYNNLRGYTLPKALLTLKNIKKAIKILQETHSKNYYEFEEIANTIKIFTAKNNNGNGYILQPCKALSAIAFNSTYNDCSLLVSNENDKMIIIDF